MNFPFEIEFDVSKLLYEYVFAISVDLKNRVENLIDSDKKFYGNFHSYLNEFALMHLIHEVWCLDEESRRTFFNRARSSCNFEQGTYLMSLELALNSKSEDEDYTYLFNTRENACIKDAPYYPKKEEDIPKYYALTPLVELFSRVLVEELGYSWERINLFIVAKLQEHVENEEDRLECVHDMYADMR